jgi:thiamine pyrophosphate-dependent acetolactate synthase large subunit-like protein
VLNDARLSLPYFGCERVGATNAQATTRLPEWDFTRHGSPMVQGQRVLEAAELDNALAMALSFDGCFVVDVHVDASVPAPVGARLDSVAMLFGQQPGAPLSSAPPPATAARAGSAAALTVPAGARVVT